MIYTRFRGGSRHWRPNSELQRSSAEPAPALTEDSVQLNGTTGQAVADANQAITVQSLEQIVRDAAAGDMSALSRLAIIR